MLQIYYGDGKGKTTAAIGLAVRAKSAGLPTAAMFFDKGGTHYHERDALTQLGVTVAATGRDRIDSTTGVFDFSITDLDRDEAMRGLMEVEMWLTNGAFRLVILDEVLNCIRLGMLMEADVLRVIEKRATDLELILTGRGLPPSLAEAADLITEMRMVKHYFQKGTLAREGIEW